MRSRNAGGTGRWRAALRCVGLFAGLVLASPAFAEVNLMFYGHQLSVVGDKRVYLPHALVRLKGSTDDGKTIMDEHFEFEPVVKQISFTPISTPGHIREAPGVPDSNEYFAVPISDEAYGRVMQVIGEWKAKKGFNLLSRNCVHFVAAVANAAGLDTPKNLRTDPPGFLAELKKRNEPRIAAAQSPGTVAAR